MLGPLADLIRTAGVADRVCLGSFSDRRLATLRQMLGPQVDTSMGPRFFKALTSDSLSALMI